MKLRDTLILAGAIIAAGCVISIAVSGGERRPAGDLPVAKTGNAPQQVQPPPIQGGLDGTTASGQPPLMLKSSLFESIEFNGSDFSISLIPSGDMMRFVVKRNGGIFIKKMEVSLKFIREDGAIHEMKADWGNWPGGVGFGEDSKESKLEKSVTVPSNHYRSISITGNGKAGSGPGDGIPASINATFGLDWPSKSSNAANPAAPSSKSAGSTTSGATNSDLANNANIDWRTRQVSNLDFKKGEEFFNRKDFETAITCFNRSIDQDSSNWTAYAMRGTSILNTMLHAKSKDRATTALEDFTKAISHHEECLFTLDRLYSHRARLFMQIEKYKEAIVDSSSAIAENPNNSETFQLRGQAYLYSYEYKSAVSDSTRAIEIDGTNAWAYWVRSKAKSRLVGLFGDVSEAIADMKQAQKLDPSLPN